MQMFCITRCHVLLLLSPMGSERRKCHQTTGKPPADVNLGTHSRQRQKGSEFAHQLGSVCSAGSLGSGGLFFVSATPAQADRWSLLHPLQARHFLTPWVCHTYSEHAGGTQAACAAAHTWTRQGRATWGINSPLVTWTRTCPDFLVHT